MSETTLSNSNKVVWFWVPNGFGPCKPILEQVEGCPSRTQEIFPSSDGEGYFVAAALPRDSWQIPSNARIARAVHSGRNGVDTSWDRRGCDVVGEHATMIRTGDPSSLAIWLEAIPEVEVEALKQRAIEDLQKAAASPALATASRFWA